MPERAFPLRAAQIGQLQLRTFEPAVVGVAVAKVELLERDVVEIDRTKADRLRREACDRATGELVVGNQPFQLDSRLHDASVGALITHLVRIARSGPT